MEFRNVAPGQEITGRKGYALEALAYGKSQPGVAFQFDHSSPNAAGRLRMLGLTTKSRQNTHDETVDGQTVRVFDSVTLECVWTPDSKEAKAAAAAAANPKPKAPKGEKKAKKEKAAK
jgi:hypothetical protein